MKIFYYLIQEINIQEQDKVLNTEERNNKFFDERIAKLDKWAEDKKIA